MNKGCAIQRMYRWETPHLTEPETIRLLREPPILSLQLRVQKHPRAPLPTPQDQERQQQEYEHVERERQLREKEQREREQRERDQREKDQRDREQREREQREQREREQREQREREQREEQARARAAAAAAAAERLEKERAEKERLRAEFDRSTPSKSEREPPPALSPSELTTAMEGYSFPNVSRRRWAAHLRSWGGRLERRQGHLTYLFLTHLRLITGRVSHMKTLT